MYFLMTNDLEHLDISSGAMSQEVGNQIVSHALPRLLKLYSKYEIKSTFFVLGSFARKFPDAIKLISREGHEIACHGYSHNVSHGFDIMVLEEQIHHLKISKRLLQKLSGQEIISFRSPALRINKDTVKALEKTGFVIDSSVCPKRLDFFLSYGSKDKWRWLDCPEKPYFMSKNDPFSIGDSNIFEIPVSGLIFGFIGSTMRSSPTLFRALAKKIMHRSNKSGMPPVFLFHPNELLPYEPRPLYNRSNNILNHMTKDFIRNSIKGRNLGDSCYNLLEEMIISFKNAGFSFTTVRKYYELNGKKNK